MHRLSPCVCAILTAAATLPAHAAPSPPEFSNVAQGFELTAGFGSSQAGYTLMGELGGSSSGIRSFADRQWLVQWDAFLAARGGILGNEHPYLPLLGMHERGDGEFGERLQPFRSWSPYVSGRLDNDVQVLTKPGVPLSGLRDYNDVDGVGGVVATGDVGIGFGVSYLEGPRSLVLEGFFQEALRAPGYVTPGRAFAEGGLRVRFDLARRVLAFVEFEGGATPAIDDGVLHDSDQTTTLGGLAAFRYAFRNGMWLGATFALSRDADRLVYESGPTYETTDAPVIGATLLYGVPIGRQE